MYRFHVAARPLRARALVLLVLALLGSAVALPATSEAAVCSTDGLCSPGQATGLPASYTGWAYASDSACNIGDCQVRRSSVDAWYWTGSSWRSAQLPLGRVYIYPYASGWRWAWTQQSGWVAISSSVRLLPSLSARY